MRELIDDFLEITPKALTLGCIVPFGYIVWKGFQSEHLMIFAIAWGAWALLAVIAFVIASQPVSTTPGQLETDGLWTSEEDESTSA